MKYGALAILLFIVVTNTLSLAWMWERYGWRSNLWWNVAGIVFAIVVLSPLVVS